MTTNHETRKQHAIAALQTRPMIDHYDLLCDAGLEEAVYYDRHRIGFSDIVKDFTYYAIEEGFIPVRMAEAYARA